jgi:hypothetical protein
MRHITCQTFILFARRKDVNAQENVVRSVQHTKNRIVALLLSSEPENIDNPDDLFEMADTGIALENSMEGGTGGGWIGCSDRMAALEMQSVEPHTKSPEVRAGQ